MYSLQRKDVKEYWRVAGIGCLLGIWGLARFGVQPSVSIYGDQTQEGLRYASNGREKEDSLLTCAKAVAMAKCALGCLRWCFRFGPLCKHCENMRAHMRTNTTHKSQNFRRTEQRLTLFQSRVT